MRRRILPYNPELKEVARRLRNNATKSETILWQYLKNRQIGGYDFHRQKPIDEFIVDFFCQELMLAIEIDGVTHDGKLKADAERQRRIESFGVMFLRFQDRDVRSNLDGVLTAIHSWVEEHTPPLRGTPLKRG